ncbi:YceI family protein [Rhodospirillum rubrum]|uniref:YceI n=1 Tax=Rhodospirillum rubrum (strain ATCC 11170 / ATH 1.1.1 / DSM 467 / LMG 4362 / NCIMB 8255 / S1) TaxID=269796 RepID=Q2RN18_RHORT|nr:YceI family protein [Rhodospirillum rubrum]ABC24477.1 YceI [Rhodospirillum rubrum ATCC 11170]AEO50228.1 YceI [Rhodospirillum rubrum F11]MBK5956203.1 YceI family protein [Rhodospirillum rubrum]QXG80395.1 YceI family protein [Rhodospirillum rubrum]HAP98498.1 YceI family protein [Rhodospirillum rubrum]
MIPRSVSRLFALALFASLGALPKPGFAADPWTADAAASRLTFQGTQMGAAFDGRFQAFTPQITFSPDDLAGSAVAVTIDMASAVTGSPDRDGEIGKPAWFDVAAHPTAGFVTTAITPAAEGKGYVGKADLTIRGITKAVEVPFTVTIDGAKAVAEGQVTVDRTDFSVGTGEWAGDGAVGRKVTIAFHIEATR